MEVDKMVNLSALPSESSFSGPPTDSSSNVASLSSTPPTTVADSISLASDTPKPDIAPAIVVEETIEASVTVALDDPEPEPEPRQTPSPGRARRARTSAAHPVYNISRLSGTDGHGKRRAKGDEVRDKRGRTISGDTLVSNGDAPNSSTDRLLRDGIEALDLQWSIRGPNTPRGARALAKKARDSPRRISTRSAGAAAESLATKVSSLGKRGRKIFEKANRMSRELKRLQDTNEFAHIDTKPIRHTVWSNGKYVDPDEIVEDEAPARKKSKVQKEDTEEPEPEKKEEVVKGPKQRRVKKYLEKGLYAGQEAPLDITKGLSIAEKKKLAELPELLPSGKLNKTLPMPIYNGFRLLLNGRDFKLPFDICNPLPPGQPKPDEWRKMTRSMQPLTYFSARHTDLTLQIALLEMLQCTGGRLITSRTTSPSASVRARTAAQRTARIALCSTSVMTRTAMWARSTARTALSKTFKRGPRKAGGSVLVLRF